jgi:hypothetical protein
MQLDDQEIKEIFVGICNFLQEKIFCLAALHGLHYFHYYLELYFIKINKFMTVHTIPVNLYFRNVFFLSYRQM